MRAQATPDTAMRMTTRHVPPASRLRSSLGTSAPCGSMIHARAIMMLVPKPR